MILALTTPLLSKGTFTVSQVTAAVIAQPNRTRYSDEEVRYLFNRTRFWCDVFGFNFDLVAAQIVHETNYLRFTGDVAFGQHNLAGLGATGGVPGHSFPSIEAGVLAVVAHHAVYRWGARENWPAELQQYAGEHVDPRYDEALDKVEELGRFMIVLGDYRGTWAVPGTTYPESLIRRSRQIEAFPRGDDPGMPRLIDMYSHTPRIDRSQVLSMAQIRVLPNFPDLPLRRFQFVTVHETSNPNVGAGAQMHRNFVANGGGSARVSFQWTVDDEVIIQIAPINVVCWHAGDGQGDGNFASNGIETCVNADGDFMKTLYNLAYLIATLQIDHGIVMADKVQHNKWSGKNCPLKIRGQGLWNWLIEGVEDWKAKLLDTGVRSFDSVPFVIEGPIKQYWERLERTPLPGSDTAIVWPTLGYPKENQRLRSIEGVEHMTQEFQRGLIIVEEENAGDWHVHHAFLDQYAPPIIVIGDDGELTPEMKELLGVLAQHGREKIQHAMRIIELAEVDVKLATQHEQPAA